MAKTILVVILKMFHKLTLDIVTVVVVVTLVVNKMKILTLSIFAPPPHSGQKKGGRRSYLVTLKFKVLLTLICPEK